MIGLERIRAAADRARPYVYRTPIVPVDGALLKLACLRRTGSFKVRGIFAAALALPEERRSRGLITVSAGNAAQACAYAARSIGVPCRVVMYETAPATKIEGVKRWGGTPLLMPRPALLDWLANPGWESGPEACIQPFAEPEPTARPHGSGRRLAGICGGGAARAGAGHRRGGQRRQHRSEAAGEPSQLAGAAAAGMSTVLAMAQGPKRIAPISIHTNRAAAGIPIKTDIQ